MSRNDNSAATGGGITFCGLLTIAFIVLKLIGVIKWSWLWVLSPIWLSALFVVLIFVVIIVLFKK